MAGRRMVREQVRQPHVPPSSSVGLSARALLGLSSTLICHAQLIQSPCPLSSAHRPTVSALRSGICRPPLQKSSNNKGIILWQNASSRIGLHSRDCTCMVMAIQPRRSECVEQPVGKRRRCAAGKSSVFEPERFRARARLHIQPPDRRGYASKGGGRIVEARAIRATVAPSTRHRLLASCWKTEDWHGCSGHVLASNIISHIQYTHTR